MSDSKRGVEVTTGAIGDVAIGDYEIYQGRFGVAKYLVVFKDKTINKRAITEID